MGIKIKKVISRCAITACATGFLFIGTAVHAAGGFAGNVNSDPLQPTLTLTNGSPAACQVVHSAFGTVSVASITQNGRQITPTAFDIASDDAPDATMTNQLQTLQPGASVDIPLRVATVGGQHFVESVTWSPDTGLYAVRYPVQPGAPLDIALTYAAPLNLTGGAPLCGSIFVHGSTAISLLGLWPWAVGVAGAAALVVLIMLWWRKKRPRTVATAAVVALAAGTLMAVAGHAPPVHAEYNVPSSAQSAFNDCMSTFNAHRDVTGPVLDALAKVHVSISPNNTQTNETARYGPNSFMIYWDPTSIYNYPGHNAGSPPIVSYPCPRLFHEMYHAFDMLNNTFSRDKCGGTDIDTKEVMATRAENRLRQALGLPQRTHYGTTPLPAGDCKQQPNNAPCTSGHCGQTNADPHLITFDGLKYDFQAVGEFVLVRDPAGDFTVQTRQQPFPGSRIVSVNSAVALKVASDRVEVRMHDFALAVLVNGKEQTMQTTKLQGGGMLIPLSDRELSVRWPDGSVVTLRAIGSYGLHAMVEPSAARAGKLEGLLGNFNGTSKDDLTLRGTGTTVEPKFSQLYPKYADSWRISDNESLFTYDKGANTSTYTDRAFPDKATDLASLPNRAAAEALCRSMGITDQTLLDDCTLDVALTGRPEFAQAMAVGQQFNSTFQGTTSQVTIARPGDTASVAFDGTAGQKVFVDIPHSSLPDQCGVVELQDPSNNYVAGGCIIGGNGYIDGTVLPATGTYHIVVDPQDDATGDATLTLITDNDQTGQLTPDGNAVVSRINRPGEVSQFTFAGIAGQKVFVRVPASTLPDECGVVGIKDPKGDVLASGCIISGIGFVNTVTLPVTGTYTIYVDPGYRNIGQSSVQVILPHDYVGTVNVNGASATAKLDKPGSIASFNFSGHAGQQIYVDASNSTLPDQCGGFYLQGSMGNYVAGDCIIHGKGTISGRQGGIVLPADGAYTVIIDPQDTSTGTVTVRVRQ